MRTVVEIMKEKKPIFQVTLIVAGSMSFLITPEPRIDNGFIMMNTEDFQYSISSEKDKGKVVSHVQGDMVGGEKFINTQSVIAYEKISSESKRYLAIQETIDRVLAAKCNIQLPPNKEIILANG